MELAKLKSKIRAITGAGNAPIVTVHLPDGLTMQVPAQKVALLSALDDLFDKQRNAETGLTIGDDNVLRADGDEEYVPLASVHMSVPAAELEMYAAAVKTEAIKAAYGASIANDAEEDLDDIFG